MQHELRWTYYNHALIPTTAPHEAVDETPLHRKDFWKSVSEGYPMLARWTSDYDCREETNWWHIIKDTPFRFEDIGYRHRKRVRKGIHNFDIRVIDPVAYAEALYQVEVEAALDYPSYCRQKVDHDAFIREMEDRRRDGITFAAFSKEDNSLAGYLYDVAHDGYIEGLLLKAKPSQKKKELSSALIYGELTHFEKDLANGVYIMAGERTIYHPSCHQEYLEKTFGFRKAYCHLHVEYRQGIKQLIQLLYPIRGLIKYLSGFKLFYLISAVLHMEEIARRSENPSPVAAGQQPETR